MRKLFISYTLFCMVMFLVSCGQTAEYAKVIPAEVDLVATFDSERIIEESGLLNENLGESQLKFKELIKKNLSAGEEELLDQIFSNPQEIGIDWSGKVYAFVPAKMELTAFLFPVSDAEKLKNSVKTFAGRKMKDRTFKDEECFAAAIVNRSLVAITEQVGLILTPKDGTNPKTLKELASTWFKQSEKSSFMSSPYFDKLSNLDGEIGLFASLERLPENISVMASMAYAEDMDISSIKYLMDISFEKGQVVADGKLMFEDKSIRDFIHKNFNATQPLKGTSLSSLPKSTPVWMGFGVDGNEFFDLISEHPVYGKELEKMSLPLDLEGMIRSIDGDFSFAYPHGIFIDVKNDEILKICVGAIKTMGRFLRLDLNEIGEDQYQVTDESRTISRFLGIKSDIQIGMKDDSFYLVTNAKALDNLNKEETLASTPWAKEVDKNYVFMAFNIKEGANLASKYVKKGKNQDTNLKYFDFVTYSQKDIDSNKIVLSLVDQQRNVIEQLIELLVLNMK